MTSVASVAPLASLVSVASCGVSSTDILLGVSVISDVRGILCSGASVDIGGVVRHWQR